MTDVHQLTGAYAVDAVDDLERLRFEHHLEGCEDCRSEVAELRETAAGLSAATAVAPPPSLRAAVLAGAARVRPLPPLPPVTPVAPVAPPPPVATDVEAPVAPNRTRRPWLLIAAAVALVAGLGAAVWQPWSEPTAPAPSAAERVLDADDAQQVSLDVGDSGSATLTRSASQDAAVIVTDGMEAAPDGKDYQLWLMAPDGSFSPAGLMSDAATQTMVLDGSAGDAAAVGITVEPDGGSPQPTSEPIALFKLPAPA